MGYPTNTFTFSVNVADFAALMRSWTVAHNVDASGHNLASQTKAGFMSPLDKAKLDALGGGAGDIGAGEINTVHLANGSITTEKIAEGVTVVGTLTGTASRATADGSGNEIVATYATKAQLNAYVQTSALNGYLALKLDASTFESYKSTTDSALALKATAADVEEALEGKQPVGDYATVKELEDGLATKQPVGSYATKTELTQGLAGKQPTGDYVLTSTHESDLATKQDKGDYATNTALTQGLAGKQAKGDYVTTATLTTELKKKQDTGDYATVTALTTGLAGKQPAGDYATNTALTSGLAGKQPVGDYATKDELADGLATKQAKGDYVTTSTLTTELAKKQNTGDYVTSSTLTTELAKKQNTGDYVTTASLTTTLAGYATDAELQAAIKSVSVTDGSITVSKLADVIDLGGL